MRNILARANRGVLDEFAWSSVLVALDYDGTLAPIVADRDRAFMRPRTALLLQKIARLYPTVIISGRARADVRKRVERADLRAVIGNHGVEPWQGKHRVMEQVRRWRPVLEQRLGAFPGVVIEEKAYTLTAHYRRSRAKKAARKAILAAAAALGGVRVIPGKQVVNILPRGAPHKGMALEHQRDRLRCDTAIYVGDDETDEDVFALEQPGRLLAIRVGAKRSSLAAYFVPRQSDVDELLRRLVAARRGTDSRTGVRG